MLNISFLACTKVDSLYCGKWRKISKSHRDLDIDPTMHIIKRVRDIFIYNNVFKFHVPRSITFGVIVQKHTNKRTNAHTHTHTRMHAHTHRLMSTL